MNCPACPVSPANTSLRRIGILARCLNPLNSPMWRVTFWVIELLVKSIRIIFKYLSRLHLQSYNFGFCSQLVSIGAGRNIDRPTDFASLFTTSNQHTACIIADTAPIHLSIWRPPLPPLVNKIQNGKILQDNPQVMQGIVIAGTYLHPLEMHTDIFRPNMWSPEV